MTREVDLSLRISRREIVADGVVALELRRSDGAALPSWTAGAHIDLLLGPQLVRQYSLCGDPADDGVWRIAVLRESDGRGGSQYVHDKLSEGDLVAVRGPRNHFALEPARRYVFIAGGIGITPILPMLAAAGPNWELHYGGRSRASMAFREALEPTLDRRPDSRRLWTTTEIVRPTCLTGPHPEGGGGQRALAGHDDESSLDGRVMLHPQDEVGLIDLDAILGVPRPETLVYCCGPEPLLRAVEAHCAAWPAGTLHIERFAPRGPGKPKERKDQGDPVRDDAFEVELVRSGMTLSVPPDRSILEVVDAAGLPVLFSCREGTCGTCETPVLDGAVDHRDSLLTDDERAANDTMFICVSRAAGPRLVLDI